MRRGGGVLRRNIIIFMASGYHTSNVQILRTSYAGERLKSVHQKVKVRTDVVSDAVLTVHILSETTRDESTSYVDDDITCFNLLP